MRRSGLMIACAILTLTFAAVAFAQSGDEKDLPYVKRATLAVRYAENKKTSVNLTGTSPAPRVLGKVNVEYKKIDVASRSRSRTWTARKPSARSLRSSSGRSRPRARPRT